jgi:Leucine-rich repeat (LRR) protein
MCPNVRLLSLKYNSLDQLPSDIGRLKKLEYLALTNNKLQVSND